MGVFKSLWDAIRLHYEKAIAFAVLVGLLGSLVYLAVQVGMIRQKDRSWRSEVESMTPRHAEAALLDESAYASAFGRIGAPALIDMEGWTNSMLTVPETRAWCVDCKRPMPMTTAITAGPCPFCGKRHVDKVLREDFDGDADGMWDGWEKKYGLNPSDASDAKDDSDRDLFSNLEEFNSDPRTDPSDPKSYPPVEAKLYVTDITADPFKLRFKSVLRIPPRVVAQTPGMDVYRLPPGSRIIVGKGVRLVLPDKIEIKFPGPGSVNALAGKRFGLVSGEETLAEFDLPDEGTVEIPAASRLEVPAGMGKIDKMAIPAGTQLACVDRQFQINLKGNVKTYLSLLGESVMGFKLAEYEERIEEKKVDWSSRPQETDSSRLTLERGGKRIVLVKNEDVMYSEYTVRFLFKLDGSEHVKKIGDDFRLKENEYRLISVDSALKTVVVRRLHDQRDFVIHRISSTQKE